MFLMSKSLFPGLINPTWSIAPIQNKQSATIIVANIPPTEYKGKQ